MCARGIHSQQASQSAGPAWGPRRQPGCGLSREPRVRRAPSTLRGSLAAGLQPPDSLLHTGGRHRLRGAEPSRWRSPSSASGQPLPQALQSKRPRLTHLPGPSHQGQPGVRGLCLHTPFSSPRPSPPPGGHTHTPSPLPQAPPTDPTPRQGCPAFAAATPGPPDTLPCLTGQQLKNTTGISCPNLLILGHIDRPNAAVLTLATQGCISHGLLFFF